MNHLRQRYQRLQGESTVKAQWSAEGVRQRLSSFYARVCPAKHGNVARIVDSFEGRGGSKQARILFLLPPASRLLKLLLNHFSICL